MSDTRTGTPPNRKIEVEGHVPRNRRMRRDVINRTEFVMRNILIIGMLLAGATMAGWLKVQRDGERTTIEIDRGEIRSDAKLAIERGREFLDRRDREFASEQTDQGLFSGQGQVWNQGQAVPQQQPPQQPQQQPAQQQWGSAYHPPQQANSGSAYQQVQYYNYQPYQQAGNQPAQQAPVNQPAQQGYRR